MNPTRQGLQLEPTVALPADEALELAAALSTLEDWLLHTGDGVLDELAFFAYRHTYHPRLAVADLVDHLGRTSSALNRAATTATNPNTTGERTR